MRWSLAVVLSILILTIGGCMAANSWHNNDLTYRCYEHHLHCPQ